MSSADKNGSSKSCQRRSTLAEIEGKAKPMKQSEFDAITKAPAKWIGNNSRPTNIVTDEGLQDVM